MYLAILGIYGLNPESMGVKWDGSSYFQWDAHGPNGDAYGILGYTGVLIDKPTVNGCNTDDVVAFELVNVHFMGFDGEFQCIYWQLQVDILHISMVDGQW